MNRFIRHAQSEKEAASPNKERGITRKGRFDAVYYGATVPFGEYEIVSSGRLRAMQTADAIEFGLYGKITSKKKFSELDMIECLPDHTPGKIGDEQAFKDMIKLSPERMYKKSTLFSQYLLSHTGKDNRISVSHGIAIDVFLYVLGLKEETDQSTKPLHGFDYMFEEKGMLIMPVNTLHESITVPYETLDALANEKIKY